MVGWRYPVVAIRRFDCGHCRLRPPQNRIENVAPANMWAGAKQQSVDDTDGEAGSGRVLFLNGNLECGRGYMALFPGIKRQPHFGLAFACFFWDPHGAVEQAASATLLQLISLA